MERRAGWVAGFRTWQWTPEDPLTLYSVLTTAPGHEWAGWRRDGPTRATCYGKTRCGSTLLLRIELGDDVLHSTAPPQAACRCGLHAWHRLGDCILYERGPWHGVTGAVLGWGRTFIYAEGWRAEFARVIALVQDPDLPVDALARAYCAAVAGRDAVEAYALEFGERAPEAAAPRAA